MTSTDMQKEMIIEKLKANGCRITKQRRMLLDIILEDECSSCKEIYYKAVKLDRRIGTATVYRMIHILEEIGAINRKNMYKVDCQEELDGGCRIELDDNTVYHLSENRWNSVVKAGLKAYGYVNEQNIRGIRLDKTAVNDEIYQ